MTLLLLPVLAFAGEGKSDKLNTLTLSDSNTISFNSKFSSSFVAQKQVEALNKCLNNVGSEIYIVLYTPGGSVSAGQLFFDTLNALPCTFNTITIFSASMGYQTVQNLGKRYILPSGILMSHRAYVSGIGGEIDGELQSIVDLLKSNVDELDNIAAKRVGLETKQYKELIRDELWMTGSQAVKMKHADEVVLVKCDSSLVGTYSERIDTFFGSFMVEFSKCPIVTGILNVYGANEKQHTEVLDYYSNLGKYITTEF